MREHFYTYPTVVELRPDRDRALAPDDAGAQRRSQPPVPGHASGVAAQPQTHGSQRYAR
jgi:hypothetical protein